MAQVTEVFPGVDGVSRTASIKTIVSFPQRIEVKMAPVFYQCSQKKKSLSIVSAGDSSSDKT